MAKDRKKKKNKSGGVGVVVASASQTQSRGSDDVDDVFKKLREEGNAMFTGKNYSVAKLKYEEALKIIPKTHPDRALFHYNLAACHMVDLAYDRAIEQCTLALELKPRYCKALVTRARAYKALAEDFYGMAKEDVKSVLNVEAKHIGALEILQSLSQGPQQQDLRSCPSPSVVETKIRSPSVVETKMVIFKSFARSLRSNLNLNEELLQPAAEPPRIQYRNLQLVYDRGDGYDVRQASVPVNCSFKDLRDAFHKCFPLSKAAVQIKFEDSNGDLVPLTCSAHLKQAKKLHIFEVSAGQKHFSLLDEEEEEIGGTNDAEVDNWLLEFARLFRIHVGFDPNHCIDLHELALKKLCSEAFNETVTSEEAQRIFDEAALEFREVAALALFNSGNVYMCAAQRKIPLDEMADKKMKGAQLDDAVHWVENKFTLAKENYLQALSLNQNLYEARCALGHQQFKMASLQLQFSVLKQIHPSQWNPTPTEIIRSFENAKKTIESAAKALKKDRQLMREKREKMKKQEKREKMKNQGSGGETTQEEEEQYAVMLKQIHLLLGNVLFEISQIAYGFKPSEWVKKLEDAVKHFKLAGASEAECSTVLNNHHASSSKASAISSILKRQYHNLACPEAAVDA